MGTQPISETTHRDSATLEIRRPPPTTTTTTPPTHPPVLGSGERRGDYATGWGLKLKLIRNRGAPYSWMRCAESSESLVRCPYVSAA